jgi:uncharacterized protein DUF2383
MADMTISSRAQFQSFLRGEIAAVETYRDALQKVTEAGPRAVLQDCVSSHELRVQRLREAIARWGETPVEGSGVWGAFAALVEGGARALGDRTAISSLARGEDHGLHEYRNNFWRLDKEGTEFVESVLLPAQEHTSQAIHELIKTLPRSRPRRGGRHAPPV